MHHTSVERVLLKEEEIRHRVRELAETITADYPEGDVLLVGLLNGSLFFLADLIRFLPSPFTLACLRASSYEGTKTSGRVRFEQPLPFPAKNRNLLLVDDILDTGLTLHTIKNFLLDEGAANVKTCVLLKKKIEIPPLLETDYFGFEIENEFVVGYGLDYMEQYRNLPYIGVLNQKGTP